MGRERRNVAMSEAFDDVAQVIDLRALEAAHPTHPGFVDETAKTAVFMKPRGVRARPTTKRLVRTTRRTKRVELPAALLRGPDTDRTEVVPRATATSAAAVLVRDQWALFGMAMLTALSLGATAVLLLSRLP